MTSHDDARAAAVLAALTDWEALLRAAISPQATTSTMVRALSVRDLEQRRRLAKALSTRSGLPHEVCDKMATDTDTDIRAQIAAYRDTPRDVLERLLTDDSSKVLRGVASNPTCPEDLLTGLARHDEVKVRRAVVDRVPDGTPAKQAKILRSWQALRKQNGPRFALGAPEPVLQILAVDPSVEVRMRLATRMIPQSVAMVLAEDTDPQVPVALARNLSIDDYTMVALVRSPQAEVRTEIAAHPKLPIDVAQYLAADPDPLVRSAVARRHGGDPQVFEVLHHDPVSDVRAALATSSSLTGAMLTRLARDRSTAVRSRVATNRHAPRDVVMRLLADPQRAVRDAARAPLHSEYPNNPIPDLSKINGASRAADVMAASVFIYWMLDSGLITENILSASLNRRFPVHLRRIILQHPLASMDLLARAANDSNPRIAEAARLTRDQRTQRALAS